MGLGSSGKVVTPGYSPISESEEALIHLLLADEMVNKANQRSALSSSFRELVEVVPPLNIGEWKTRWNLDRWESEAAESRLDSLLTFIWLCAEAVQDGDDTIGPTHSWPNWLPGNMWHTADLLTAAQEWLDGASWTKLLKIGLGSDDDRTRLRRLWEGENPETEDNSGDALVKRNPQAFKPLVFTWNPIVETQKKAKARLRKAGQRYLQEMAAQAKVLKRTRPGVNEDHFLWLARRLILDERPVDTTVAVLRKSQPTSSEINRIRAGQKSAAELIGLKLRPARPGPRQF